MLLPFIMEQADAMKEAIPAFKAGQPVGDGIGPMVVGKMMLDITKETVAFQTVLAKTEFENRTLFLLKAEGPSSTVGRPADALEIVVSSNKLDAIIMIDAALKMEGEDSASVSQGFGAAIGPQAGPLTEVTLEIERRRIAHLARLQEMRQAVDFAQVNQTQIFGHSLRREVI